MSLWRFVSTGTMHAYVPMAVCFNRYHARLCPYGDLFQPVPCSCTRRYYTNDQPMSAITSLLHSCQLSLSCSTYVSCHFPVRPMSAVTSLADPFQLSFPCPFHVSRHLLAQLMSAVISLPIPCQLSPPCPVHVSCHLPARPMSAEHPCPTYVSCHISAYPMSSVTSLPK